MCRSNVWNTRISSLGAYSSVRMGGSNVETEEEISSSELGVFFLSGKFFLSG